MIMINLLPEELRPIKRTPVPYMVAVALALGLLAGVGFMILSSMQVTSGLRADIAKNDQLLKGLQHIVDEYNELGEKKVALKDKVETIEEILRDRKIWSEHLDRLSHLTPDNFWYSRIRETTQTFRENRPKIDPKTNKPVMNEKGELETVQERVVRPVLELQGYVTNDAEGRANVYELMDNTTNDPEFSKHFELFRPRIEDTQYQDFNVRGFTLEYTIEAGIDNEEEK
ncbi:MAG: hypothetical protein GC168_03120 [Candidatus Hydrogenedens sp.]|nr:hypothetical protein [Candidatus Hydrogenedens sp.]